MRRARRTMAEINMVPFIDVMLVLLIIFMVTAPLITPSMIDLPSVGKAAKQPDKVLQVIIGKDESLRIRWAGDTLDQPVAQTSALAAAVKTMLGNAVSTGNTVSTANAATTAVVISADKTVKYETVVRTMDALQRAGVSRLGLSVQLQN